jgi:hypothetical protein
MARSLSKENIYRCAINLTFEDFLDTRNNARLGETRDRHFNDHRRIDAAREILLCENDCSHLRSKWTRKPLRASNARHDKARAQRSYHGAQSGLAGLPFAAHKRAAFAQW